MRQWLVAMGARPTLLLVSLALAAGIALRLAYPSDIEFKADERWSFDQARAVLEGQPWPTLGMPMSVGGRNPGLSVGIFVGLAWVSGAKTPPALARAVQVANCLALLAFALFAVRSVPPPAREAWLWAAMLWAVNPAAVIFERKIWPPSVLPLLTVCLIAAWWHRRTWIGSFFLVAVGAIMSQIHPVAALLIVSLLLWGFAEDQRPVHWSALILGGVLGALPALPWFLTIVQSGGSRIEWRAWPLLDFYRRWILQPFGLSAHYTLGTGHFTAFLRWPIVGGLATYGLGLAHGALAVAMIALVLRAMRALAFQSWTGAGALFCGRDGTGRLIRATLWGYGGLLSLLTIIGVGTERHYMIAIAPVMALWVARLAAFPGDGCLTLASRALLTVCCAGQLLVSAGLLEYVHRVQIVGGAYGATWAAQQRGLAPSPPAIHIAP